MTATDELDYLKLIAAEMLADKFWYSGSFEDLGAVFFRIKADIKSVLFSNASDEAVNRYCDYRLREIIAIALDVDKSFKSVNKINAEAHAVISGHLCQLIDFILEVNPAACGGKYVPAQYLRHVIGNYKKTSADLKRNLKNAFKASQLFSPIENYLAKIESGGVVTFYALNYYINFLNAFSGFDFAQAEPEAAIHQKLLALNFNDLNYLYAFQEDLNGRLKLIEPCGLEPYIGKEKDIHILISIHQGGCYPQFPHLSTMIRRWLEEKFATSVMLIQPQHMPCNQKKLVVNLPVSQIALLIRIFQAAGAFGNIALTELLTMTCQGLSSKKQKLISKGSLSKEYYSVNQITAGRVLDLLQQMSRKIRHDFFPD